MPEIRPVDSDDDLRRCLALVASVFPERAVTLGHVHAMRVAVPVQQHFLATLDGDPVASTLVRVEPRMQERSAAFASIVVVPEARGRGAGGASLARVSDWAGARGLVQLEGIAMADDSRSLAWVRRRGFEETAREAGLKLDLTTIEPPPATPPDGVDIVTWAARPELARGLYAVAAEAMRDIPGNEDESLEPFDAWLEHDMRGPGDSAEATFVAVAGDEVVGYSKFMLNEAQPTRAFHDLTAVRRPWRGRGIARALKATQIRWAREHGYEELLTNNEERNEPIRKLNAEFGYRPAGARVFVRGPLARA